MAEAPTYRIGPSDFFNSADLAADARVLNGQINGLDDANWDRPPQDLFDAWNAFKAEWRKFYSSTFDGTFNFSAWNNSNRDQLIQYEQRFAAFAAQYQQASGHTLPGAVVAPSSGTKDSFGDHIRNQLQPLIPQFNVNTVFTVLAIAAVALGVYMFRAPLQRALAKVTK